MLRPCNLRLVCCPTNPQIQSSTERLSGTPKLFIFDTCAERLAVGPAQSFSTTMATTVKPDFDRKHGVVDVEATPGPPILYCNRRSNQILQGGQGWATMLATNTRQYIHVENCISWQQLASKPLIRFCITVGEHDSKLFSRKREEALVVTI